MNPHARVMDALSKRMPDRLPCINSAGTYTKGFMVLSNARMPEAHKDPELMAWLGSAAHRFCGLDNVSIPFDALVEAEAMGAELNYGKFWPRPKGYLNSLDELKLPMDVEGAGRVKLVLKAIRLLEGEFEGVVPINVIVTPPLTSIGLHRIGQARLNILLKRMPELVKEALDSSLDFYIELIGLYEDAGADVITLHDTGASCDVVSSIIFEEFSKPYLKELVKRAKPSVILNICGNVIPVVKGMAECNPSAIAFGEKSSVAEVRRILEAEGRSVPLSGNISPLRLYEGTRAEIEEKVRRVIKEGVKLVAPGYDFHLETPKEKISAMVHTTIKYGRARLW